MEKAQHKLDFFDRLKAAPKGGFGKLLFTFLLPE